MFGDQWICKCGFHNIIFREKCRGCKKERIETQVGEESALEVMAAVRRSREKRETATQK